MNTIFPGQLVILPFMVVPLLPLTGEAYAPYGAAKREQPNGSMFIFHICQGPCPERRYWLHYSPIGADLFS